MMRRLGDPGCPATATAAALALALVLPAAPAAAHDLEIDYGVDGRVLRVEVYFPPAAPAPDARVSVLADDDDQAVLAEGAADAAGVYRCRVPPGVSRVLVRAEHSGHQASVAVAVEDGAARRARGGRDALWKIPLGVLLIIGLFGLIRLVLRGSRKRSAGADDGGAEQRERSD